MTDMNNNIDMTHPMAIIWIVSKVRRPGKAKAPGKIQQRIESIVIGLLIADTADRDAWRQGLRMEDLTAITGYTAAQIRPVMQALIAAGVVRRTGNTRATRYQAVAL